MNESVDWLRERYFEAEAKLESAENRIAELEAFANHAIEDSQMIALWADTVTGDPLTKADVIGIAMRLNEAAIKALKGGA